MADDSRLYRVPDVMQKLRMSRNVIYEQLRSGRLRSVKQGRCRLIPGRSPGRVHHPAAAGGLMTKRRSRGGLAAMDGV